MRAWGLFAVVLCALLAIAGPAAAGGLNRIGGLGPRAGGMAGSYTAIADDASLFYYNVAGMTQFDEPYAETATDLLFPRFTYDSRIHGRAVSQDSLVHVLPFMGYIHPINDRVAAGIGVYVPYGMGADFENNPQRLGFHTASLISLTNISPSVAFELTDRLSLGLSLDIGYAQLHCQVPFDMAGVYLPLPTDSKGDGFGLGGSVGLLWTSERVSLGAMFSTGTHAEIDGVTNMGSGYLSMRDGFVSQVNYPERASVGIAVQATDKLRLAADACWYGYTHDMTDLTLDFRKIPIKKAQALDWQDNYSVSLGAEYALSEAWTLRGGYRYTEAAIPEETVSTVTPDSDASDVTFGVECNKGPLSVAGFVLYAWGERAVGSTPVKEEYDVDIVTVGGSISYRF